MEKRWVFKETDQTKADALQKELKIHPVLCRLLVQRGITSYEDAKKFFRPSLEDLHSPWLMKNMHKAVDRIVQAISSGEKILIYGDYDVDGTTAVALVYSFFRSIYPNIDFYIPDRYTEGYGISFKAIDYAKNNNFSLVIALDCGIKANDKIEKANAEGIDFIICDHHLPGDAVPDAVAVLDPHQHDCKYPYKELSGCGIGFKLVQAFAEQHGIPFAEIQTYLDLVVVSIASDIVPITDENRILAFHGLEILNSRPRTGLQALIGISGFQPPLTINNIVFGLGPRINAAGRMDDARKAVLMLISETEEHARNGADILHDKNNDRKEVDKLITQQALEMLLNDPETPLRVSTVLFSDEWHKGVVGIVASRVIDHFYRPTILLTLSHGFIVGSARSIKGFDIYEAIRECSDLLEQFGGHMFAAGLMLRPENLQAFRKKFDDVVRARIRPDQLIPEMEIDAEIDLADIKPSFYNILKQFAPFGPSNMYPVFMTKNMRDNGRTRIVGENHLKLGVRDNKYFVADAIAFQKGDFFRKINDGNYFDICYAIEENLFNDRSRLQLNVKEIRVMENGIQ